MNQIFHVCFLEIIIDYSFTDPIPPLGIPQTPLIFQSSSSGGAVVLRVSTKASGAPPSGWVEFVIRAEHIAGKEQLLFRQRSREYSDGEEMEVRLSGFPVDEEEGEDSTYNFFVGCHNEYGVSNESEPVRVTVDFSSFAGEIHFMADY